LIHKNTKERLTILTNKLTKNDFIRRMAEKYNIKIVDAEKYFYMVLDTIKDCLSNGDAFCFSGYFSMGVKKHKGHGYKNPKTGEIEYCDDFMILYCRFSKEIKDNVGKLNNSK